MTPEQEIERTKAGQRLYAEAGVTTAHEGASHLAQLRTMKRAAEAGANVIDLIAYPFITDVDNVLEEIPASTWGAYSKRFKIGGVKITIDGSPQGGTALFTRPYRTGGPGSEKSWSGELTFPQDVVSTRRSRRSTTSGSPSTSTPTATARSTPSCERTVRRGRRPHEGPARDDDPRAVHPQEPDPEVRGVQDPSLVLHPAHLLLRRGAHREPRSGTGHVHQPDARRDRRRAPPHQPHGLCRRPARPDDDALVRGEPGLPRGRARSASTRESRRSRASRR